MPWGKVDLMKLFIKHHTLIQTNPKRELAEKKWQWLESLKKKQEAEQHTEKKLEEEKRWQLKEIKLNRRHVNGRCSRLMNRWSRWKRRKDRGREICSV